MNDGSQGLSFLKNTGRFTKSPLGIIALFISLVYAFACLLMGTSGSNLQDGERLVLLIFLVTFPLVVLISFIYLVTRHSRKLYGPSDFKDERNFLETIDITSQKSELKDHILNFKGTPKLEENSNVKEKSISRFKDYLLVENLVIRIVEKEFNLPQRRYVKFKGFNFTFDCILEGQDEFIAIKIKYIRPDEEQYNTIVALKLKQRYNTFQKIANQYYRDKQRKMIIYIVYKKNIESFKEVCNQVFAGENTLQIVTRYFSIDSLIDKFLY